MKLTGLLIFLLLTFAANGQPEIKNPDVTDSTYKIYLKQLSDLYTARGMRDTEIDSILLLYARNRITSNQNFADILGTLYPNDQGIACLVYFFNRDTLQTILFEPGAVIQIKKQRIKKETLLLLNQEILSSLKVFSLSANRSVTMRGTQVENRATKVPFATIIKKATRILLPEKFTAKYKHLIIVPALNIGATPFHLLKPYKNNVTLIEKCSYTVAPSLLDVIALRTRIIKIKTGMDVSAEIATKRPYNSIEFYGQPAPFSLKNSLFISNPAYPTNTQFIFPNLPGASAEVDAASQYASDPTILRGKQARKGNMLDYMNGSDLVYFATHGVSSEHQPMDSSFLVLSGNDPFFTAREIMDLRLDENFKFPQMAILSACQTGLGKYMEAGIAGLARPFLIGGSNHVIMSLWNVDDAATAFLMSRFMLYMHRHLPFSPSGPLRLAILDTKKKYKNPVYWASFAHFGVDF